MGINLFDFFGGFLKSQPGNLYLSGEHHTDRPVRRNERLHDQIGVVVNTDAYFITGIDPVDRFFLLIKFFEKFQLTAFILIGQARLIDHAAGQIVDIGKIVEISGITVVTPGKHGNCTGNEHQQKQFFHRI